MVWWISFIFLLGLLACCISGFVTTNRFGFALQGSYCSFERFYYDSAYGQLKVTDPRWEGFTNISTKLNDLKKIINDIKDATINYTNSWISKKNENLPFDGYFPNDYYNYMSDLYNNYNENNVDVKAFIEDLNECLLPIASRFGKIIDSVKNFKNNFLNKIFVEELDNLSSDFSNLLNNDFKELNSKFLNEFYYFARIANGWLRVLTMIYYCLLLIAVTFAGFSMMFYVCLRNQGYLSIFMHVLWNIIRFFIFSFFFYGAAYGMCYLALRDAVAYVMYVFGDNINQSRPQLIPTGNGKLFLSYCLSNTNINNDYKNQLDKSLTISLEDFFTSLYDLKYTLQPFKTMNEYKDYSTSNSTLKEIFVNVTRIQNSMITVISNFLGRYPLNDNTFDNYAQISSRHGGLFGSFDCSFLKSDLAMMYRTLYDLSVEARINCALSCCIGFFGAIAVYFYLLVLHHYNYELFFDADRSIFIGFDDNKKHKSSHSHKDPSSKKRKIRSEIELSSRNEEYSAANKNED